MKLKRSFGKFLILVGVLTLLLVPTLTVFAAPPPAPAVYQAETPAATLPPFDLSNILVTFSSLTGVAMFITALVNSLKALGWVKDGQASAWSAGLNLLALIGLIVLQVIGKISAVPAIDSQAGVLAGILTAMIGLVVQIWVSRKTHESVLAGLPVVGSSNSGRVAGDQSYVLEADTGVITAPTVSVDDTAKG
jgi:hypothetical protein